MLKRYNIHVIQLPGREEKKKMWKINILTDNGSEFSMNWKVIQSHIFKKLNIKQERHLKIIHRRIIVQLQSKDREIS